MMPVTINFDRYDDGDLRATVAEAVAKASNLFSYPALAELADAVSARVHLWAESQSPPAVAGCKLQSLIGLLLDLEYRTTDTGFSITLRPGD